MDYPHACRTITCNKHKDACATCEYHPRLLAYKDKLKARINKQVVFNQRATINAIPIALRY